MSAGNLIILTQYFLPETGAPQSRLYETAAGLTQRGWNVMIVTAMPNYPTGTIFPAYRNKFSMQEKVQDVAVHRYTLYPSKSSNKLPRIVSMLSFSVTSLCSFFKARKFEPDYIFTESPPLTLGLTGLALAKLTGAKHILNVADLWPLSAYRLGAISKGFMYRRLAALEKFLYKRSYACMGQSQEIIDHITSNGGKKTHLYRNGVDITRFGATLHSHRKSEGKLKIIYTGLLGVAQGIVALCKQINFTALGAELHIYGDGVEKEMLLQYLTENSDTGIQFHGIVDREQIPAILATADITIIPLVKSIKGAIPSKMYEAMAAGLPIIFSGGREGAEIIRRYDLGWICPPGDYKEIAECIKNITRSNRELLAIKRENCLLAAQNVFDRKQQLEQLHQFLLAGK